MKQVFPYILLFSLVIRPLFIVGHIAYYELNIDYITEKFCENKDKPQLQCNGKCHLAKELSVVSSDISNNLGDGVNQVAAFESFVPLFYQFKNNAEFTLFGFNRVNINAAFYYSDCYSFLSEYCQLKPPIV